MIRQLTVLVIVGALGVIIEDTPEMEIGEGGASGDSKWL